MSYCCVPMIVPGIVIASLVKEGLAALFSLVYNAFAVSRTLFSLPYGVTDSLYYVAVSLARHVLYNFVA